MPSTCVLQGARGAVLKTNLDPVKRWLALGDAGLMVSICYGRFPSGRLQFSVNVLSAQGESFSRPYAAESLEQAVDIAEIETRKRGWLPS